MRMPGAAGRSGEGLVAVVQPSEVPREPVVLLDCWKRRRIRGYDPSPAAVARRKAIPPQRLTSGGQNADWMHAAFLGRPRRQPEALGAPEAEAIGPAGP
jgi:hypothetical protein